MDSRTTARVNRSGLRLTPRKQDSFQSVARGVIKTTTSVVPASTELGSQCRPSLTNPSATRRRTSQISPSPRTQPGTQEIPLTPSTRSQKALCTHRHACSVASTITAPGGVSIPRERRPSYTVTRTDSPNSTSCHGEQIQTKDPRQSSRAAAAAQYHVRADG